MTPVRRITRSIMIDHPEKDEREMTTPETIEVFVGDVKQNDVFVRISENPLYLSI